jgi:hypothetical protein
MLCIKKQHVFWIRNNVEYLAKIQHSVLNDLELQSSTEADYSRRVTKEKRTKYITKFRDGRPAH